MDEDARPPGPGRLLDEQRLWGARVLCVVGVFLWTEAAVLAVSEGTGLLKAQLGLVAGGGVCFVMALLRAVPAWIRLRKDSYPDRVTDRERARLARDSADTRLSMAPWILVVGLGLAAWAAYRLVEGGAAGVNARWHRLEALQLGALAVYGTAIGVHLYVTGYRKKRLADELEWPRRRR
jgi:hypothetical protein